MEYTLEVTPREVLGKKVKRTRAEGKMPAVIYGKGITNTHVFVDEPTFFKLFKETGTSAIVTLHMKDTKPVKVLIREPQIDPTTLKPLHIDFHQINMKEKIRTEVPLEFINESPAVVDLDAKLSYSLDAVEVECLPDDLIQHIEVDISVLKAFDDAIHVKDLVIPDKIELLTDQDLVVVVAQEPISEEALEEDLATEANEADAIAAVEEASGEKPEGEESASAEE